MNNNIELNEPNYDQIVDAIVNILVDAGATYHDAKDIMCQLMQSLGNHKINGAK